MAIKKMVLSVMLLLFLGVGEILGAEHEDCVSDKRQVQERGTINPAFDIGLLPIAGTDWLGWGVDLKLGLPEDSVKTPMFKFSYNLETTYRYPLYPEKYFKVPDDVYIRTIAETISTTRYFLKLEDYKKNLELGIGLGFEGATGSGTNVTGSTQGMFSGSVDVNYYSQRLSTEENLVLENNLENSLWQLVIGPTVPLRPQVAEAGLQAASKAAQSGNLLALVNFVSRFGTHFIESVIVGGKLAMTSITQKKNETNFDNLAILANLNFKEAFGLKKGNVEIELTFNETFSTFTKESSNSLKALGGDPQLANFFSSANAGNSAAQTDGGQIFEMWQDTLINNPSPIRFRVREISWLFPDQMDKMHEAVQAYLSGSISVY